MLFVSVFMAELNMLQIFNGETESYVSFCPSKKMRVNAFIHLIFHQNGWCSHCYFDAIWMLFLLFAMNSDFCVCKSFTKCNTIHKHNTKQHKHNTKQQRYNTSNQNLAQLSSKLRRPGQFHLLGNIYEMMVLLLLYTFHNILLLPCIFRWIFVYFSCNVVCKCMVL